VLTDPDTLAEHEPAVLAQTAQATGVMPNYVHDLESVWWLLLWILLTRVHHEHSMVYSRDLFFNSISLYSSRANAFTEQNTLRNALGLCILPDLKPLVLWIEYTCTHLVVGHQARATRECSPYLRTSYAQEFMEVRKYVRKVIEVAGTATDERLRRLGS
jgi:hypothetical protein